MDFILNIWNKIKNPRMIYLILFYIFFALVLTGTLVLVILVQNQTIWHYILYVIATVSLTYMVYTIVIYAPRMKENFIKLLRKYKFTNTILDNYGYRTIVFSICSFVLNMAYVIFLGVLGIMSKSYWYISLTVYYLCLSVMKGNVFNSMRKYNTDIKRARAYRYCGIIFILLTIALSGIIVLIYTSNMAFEYAGLMIYAVAAYTFYKLGIAIYNIFKARRYDNVYIQSIRNINLVSALVSILVLQVALFQAFAPEYNLGVANGLTGGAVAIVILALSIFMIYKANKLLESSKGNTIDEEE